MIELKIANAADQKFSTIIDSQRVTFRLRYNYVADFWSFDLALDGDYVLHGRRIVKDVDLIKPFNFGIGILFAYSSVGAHPGREELPGGLVKIYQVTEAERDAALA